MNSYLLHPAFLQRVPRKWPEISIFIRWERTYLTSSLPSPGTSGKTWAQRQKEPRGIRDNDCGNKANESAHHSSVSQPNLYRSLLIPCGLRVQYGGLADGFTDGPCLKLRTRCLSITMLVHCLSATMFLFQHCLVNVQREEKRREIWWFLLFFGGGSTINVPNIQTYIQRQRFTGTISALEVKWQLPDS